LPWTPAFAGEAANFGCVVDLCENSEIVKGNKGTKVPTEDQELAAGIAAKLVERFIAASATKIGKSAKKVSEDIAVLFNTCFKPYLASQYDLYSKTKVIVSPLQPVNIADVFEPPEISVNNERKRYPTKRGMDFKSFEDLLKDKARIIVTAIAGSGKSMFLKYLFLSMCKGSGKYLPIFIELRALNELSKKDIKSYLFAQISAANGSFTNSQMQTALSAGKFCAYQSTR